MRVELENNQTTLDNFIASLGAVREPVELTRKGRVVAKVSKVGKAKKVAKATAAKQALPEADAETARIIGRGRQILRETLVYAQKHHPNVTERQLARDCGHLLKEIDHRHLLCLKKIGRTKIVTPHKFLKALHE